MCHFFEGIKRTFNSGCGFQARAILHIIGAAINQLSSTLQFNNVKRASSGVPAESQFMASAASHGGRDAFWEPLSFVTHSTAEKADIRTEAAVYRALGSSDCPQPFRLET